MMSTHTYTCNCCGYKTLPTNDIGEICPICFWEEDYSNQEDAFNRTGANSVCLYQAQMNFLETGSSSRKVEKFCRKPLINDVRDLNWLSIQQSVENEYTDINCLANKIVSLRNKFRDDSLPVILQNFKQMDESRFNEEFDDNDVVYLTNYLRSLCLALSKMNIMKLKEIFTTYYTEGSAYYAYWRIMLEVLIRYPLMKEDPEFTDVILSIELNDFYGSRSLRDKIKEFWLA